MFALTYTNLSGYDSCDAEFKVIAVSPNKEKLERYADELEKPSREYDKTKLVYDQKCCDIVLELIKKNNLTEHYKPWINNLNWLVKDLKDYIRNSTFKRDRWPINILLEENIQFPEEPKINSYYYVQKGYCNSGLNVIEVTEI